MARKPKKVAPKRKSKAPPKAVRKSKPKPKPKGTRKMADPKKDEPKREEPKAAPKAAAPAAGKGPDNRTQQEKDDKSDVPGVGPAGKAVPSPGPVETMEEQGIGPRTPYPEGAAPAPKEG